MQGDNQEFVLLVSLKEGPTKTYQFDGFSFYETPVTFTGGSLGRGVSTMRTYKINNDIWVIGMHINIVFDRNIKFLGRKCKKIVFFFF